MSTKSITKIIKGWVCPDTKSEIETFIASRNPKNIADVEDLIKQWNYSRKRHWLQ